MSNLFFLKKREWIFEIKKKKNKKNTKCLAEGPCPGLSRALLCVAYVWAPLQPCWPSLLFLWFARFPGCFVVVWRPAKTPCLPPPDARAPRSADSAHTRPSFVRFLAASVSAAITKPTLMEIESGSFWWTISVQQLASMEFNSALNLPLPISYKARSHTLLPCSLLFSYSPAPTRTPVAHSPNRRPWHRQSRRSPVRRRPEVSSLSPIGVDLASTRHLCLLLSITTRSLLVAPSRGR
jgi:hypothetical protein